MLRVTSKSLNSMRLLVTMQQANPCLYQQMKNTYKFCKQSNTTNETKLSVSNIVLPYPYQYTFQSQNLLYHDPRFTEYPINQNFTTEERSHLISVLQQIEQMMSISEQNQKNRSKSKQRVGMLDEYRFIHPSIRDKIQEFRKELIDNGFELRVKVNEEEVQQSIGYLEMHIKEPSKQSLKEGQEQPAINNAIEPEDFFRFGCMHEYEFTRGKQTLMIEKKKAPKKKKSQQDVLKEDIQKMMDEKSGREAAKDFFDNVTGKSQQKQNQKEITGERAKNILFDMIKKKLSPTKQNKSSSKKQPYLLSNLVRSQMNVKLKYSRQESGEELVFDEDVDLYTKWMYVVESNESESVRQSRKRILYDFQFWNRGTFFEVKDWTKKINKV